MQKWEYQTVTDVGYSDARHYLYRRNGTLKETGSSDVNIVDVLNELGQQGWEAVSAYQDDESVSFLLKRPVK